ncbi:hypothetical protein C475_22294 [Halosimplex carlsbadense 2-9-1]|uniref:Uncharacterized protein n=1 Tax=Halosimplex carlsbadense 2-9-1 TaxID=797114 RepID=M0CBI9_9EURY|nr:hypothetical protein [Halosimplex carlsbadense]ELZ19722.1 hypothetical protein C475_22294 [Halosimplex carlsbadense 2-9-1]
MFTPEILEIGGVFVPIGGSITHTELDTLWLLDVALAQSVDIPLQSGLSSDLLDAVQVPAWVGMTMKKLGLVVLILGTIGYFMSPSLRGRRRSFQFAVSGLFLTVFGIAFVPLQNLIAYVLNG